MALVNEHYLKLPGNYLFSDIAKKINTFKVTHPGKRLIRLGIGDVTRPLPQACITAMHKAVDEMSKAETFHGYGPEQGYDFLIEAILKNDFASRGISLSPTEIFINDGAKSDTGNMAFGEVSGLHGINAGRLGLDVPGQSLLRYNAVCQPFQNLHPVDHSHVFRSFFFASATGRPQSTKQRSVSVSGS